MRARGPARAWLQAAALQAPPAARHLHQSRRSGGHGHGPAARRPQPPARPYQSGRRHAQSHGQRDCITQETSKTKPPHVAM